MITYEDSRYLRSTVIRVVGPGGRLLKPQWLDFSTRITNTLYYDNQYVTVDSSSSWAHLGLRYLQDARAWWAIAEFSDILDPFTDLEEMGNSGVAATLVVPSRTTFAFNVSPAGGRTNP